LYPVVFVDALRVKIRDEGTVRSKVGYLALGVLADGTRDILGVWIEQTEGAKFWMKVFTELKTRGYHRGHRRAQRDERSDRGRVSGDDAPDLSRAPDAAKPRPRQLERAQAAGGGAAADLHGAIGGRRGRGPHGLRGERLGPVAFRRSARRGDARGRP